MIFVALQETCPLALAIDVTEISSAQYHEAWTTSVTAAVQRQGHLPFDTIASWHGLWRSARHAPLKLVPVSTLQVQRGAYRFLADRAMVGLLLLLYVRDDLVPQVSQTLGLTETVAHQGNQFQLLPIRTCWGTTRCGTLGAGNKGAVAFGLAPGTHRNLK